MENILRLAHQGIYCPAGDFYVDPWGAVEKAVITHAHADHARVGHKKYYAHPDCIPILHHRLGDIDSEPKAYGEEFQLGDARVSLHSAGHILGSAQVRIAVGDQVTVVTGDFKRTPDPTCAPFELVTCDTLITEATFSLPVYRWPNPKSVAEDIFTWWMNCRERRLNAVLCCYALGKAQRVMAELMRFTDESVVLHGAVLPITQIYRSQGVQMLEGRPVEEGENYAGQLVIAPPSAIGSPWIKRFGRHEAGFCSGWMRIRGNRRRRGYERGFVLSDHADWNELVNTIRESGAQKVMPTHGRTDSLVRYLREQDIDAEALETVFGESEE